MFSQPHTPSVAFYYGNNVPVDMLSQFDWVVVESAHLPKEKYAQLKRHGAQVFAYLSLGEVEAWRVKENDAPKSALVAKNKHWDSAVADLTQPAWGEYIIEDRIRPLWQSGYRGFFLDTLDSYRLFATEEAEADKQQVALVNLIKKIRQVYPGIKLILNRGFEILDRVQDDVIGIAAESLYQQWDPSNQQYGPVPEDQQDYLMAQFKRIRDRYQLPLIAIDYVAPEEREKARATAHRIAAAGFIPWVSTWELNQVGIGLIEPMPRKVLILYDKSHTEGGELAYTLAHRHLAMPLEYLGYGAIYHDVNTPLPSDILHGRYGGIVSWFSERLQQGDAYQDWLLKQLKSGLRVAIFGVPGVDLSGSLGDYLGIQHATLIESQGTTIVSHDTMLGFEGMPAIPPRYQSGFSLQDERLNAHLTLQDGLGQQFVPTLTGPWGGVASFPWIIQYALPGQARWILDPFAFLQAALQLPDMPVADATTENGSRYAMAQVNGHAFSRGNFPGTPFTGEILKNKILTKYKLPTSVSINEGEYALDGTHPDLDAQKRSLAKTILGLPWVEVATHISSSYFYHSIGENNLPTSVNNPEYISKVLSQKVSESIKYINQQLAPPEKNVNSILWEGGAYPTETALATAKRIGLENINGGDTSIINDNPTLLEVSPMLRPQGNYLQVYAPQNNENAYTNNMTTPLWGYRRVIETYQLTDLPRRLKPIDINYHFYSAAHPASLKALDEVYRYVNTQQTLPLFSSNYSKIAQNWYEVGIARRLDGGWQIRGATQARTLRLPPNLGWPDLHRSNGVAGVRDMGQGRYVSLSGTDEAILYLTPEIPSTAHIRRANGRLIHWQRTHEGQLRLSMTATHVPLELELAGVEACRVTAPNAQHKKITSEGLLLRYDTSESGVIEVTCEQ